MNYKYLYMMFPKKEERVRFISSSILTFGLSLDVIASLLQTDANYLYNYISVDNPLWDSVNKIFNSNFKNQIKAKEEFVNYFNKLEEAHKNNKEKFSELLDVVKDKKFKEIKEKLNARRPHLTDEEIVVIIKYQIKYMLNNKAIAFILGIDRESYIKRVKALSDNYPELVKEYDELAKMNQRPFFKARQKKSFKGLK